MRNFKEQIKEMRKQTGLSQAKFAEFMEIPYTTYRKWEIGQACPTEYTLKMMQKILAKSDIEKDTLIKELRAERAKDTMRIVELEIQNDELQRRIQELEK